MLSDTEVPDGGKGSLTFQQQLQQRGLGVPHGRIEPLLLSLNACRSRKPLIQHVKGCIPGCIGFQASTSELISKVAGQPSRADTIQLPIEIHLMRLIQTGESSRQPRCLDDVRGLVSDVLLTESDQNVLQAILPAQRHRETGVEAHGRTSAHRASSGPRGGLRQDR